MVLGAAAFALLLVYALGLLEGPTEVIDTIRHARTDLTIEATTQARCTEQKICVVSANAPTRHSGGIAALMQGCLRADAQTQVIALAMQDFPGRDEVPPRVSVEGLGGGKGLKLRYKMMLENTGKSALCDSHFQYGKWAAMIACALAGLKIGSCSHATGPVARTATMTCTAILGATAGAVAYTAACVALDADRGVVALLVYSLHSSQVHLDMGVNTSITLARGITATTRKGTVMARFGLNGHHLVIASTHGQEGVRGKHRDEACSAATPGTKDEHRRVEDFKLALDKIQQLRQGSSKAIGAIWAGDFNSRSVEPDGERMGCPIWPLADEADTNATRDVEDLHRLKRGRGVLGSLPKRSTPVTFQELLQDSGLREADDLVCPTYRKEERQSGEQGARRQFRCREKGETMFYKASHPPSWVDRIFYSAEQSWLKCSKLKRVTHKTDHDAVLLSCSIAGQCDG